MRIIRLPSNMNPYGRIWIVCILLFSSCCTNCAAKECGAISCSNGECRNVSRIIQCVCHQAFFGDRCDFVNTSQSTINADSSSTKFTWSHPIDLTGYEFLYKTHDKVHHIPVTAAGRHSVVLRGLQSTQGGLEYSICIVKNRSSILTDNCVQVEIQPEGWTSESILVIICGTFLVCSVIGLVMAHIIRQIRQKTQIKFYNLPEMEWQDAEKVMFDIFENKLHIKDARQRIMFNVYKAPATIVWSLRPGKVQAAPPTALVVHFADEKCREEVIKAAQIYRETITVEGDKIKFFEAHQGAKLNCPR